MNVWRRGPITENVYLRTAFRVCRVPREVTRRRTLVQMLNQTRNVIRADPTAHTVASQPVTQEQLNLAEKILLDPDQRIQEELLHHATRELPQERLRKLAERCARAMAERTPDDEKAPSLRGIESWLSELIGQSCQTLDPSFGALELTLDPPFGPLEDSQDGPPPATDR